MSGAFEFPSLLFWADPVQSGVVFGSVLAFLVLLCYNSLITMVSYTFLIILFLISLVRLYTFVMVTFKKVDSAYNPLATISSLPLTIPSSLLSDMSPCIADTINTFLHEMKSLFLFNNIFESIQFGLCLWCLTYIGSWFNAITLIIIAWIAAFTIPKVYKTNQEQVDKVVEQMNKQLEELKEKIISTIPGLKKSEKQD